MIERNCANTVESFRANSILNRKDFPLGLPKHTAAAALKVHLGVGNQDDAKLVAEFRGTTQRTWAVNQRD